MKCNTDVVDYSTEVRMNTRVLVTLMEAMMMMTTTMVMARRPAVLTVMGLNPR